MWWVDNFRFKKLAKWGPSWIFFFVFNDENINLESYNNVKSKFPSNSSYILYDLAILYNQEQKKTTTNKQTKKRNTFKIDFLIFILIKIHLIMYQIKHNWMNFMMVKTVSKNILQWTFYTSLKSTFKKHESQKASYSRKTQTLNYFLMR